MSSIRYALVNPDNPRSVAARARARRWGLFATAFPDLETMNVLDLGGSPRFWRTTPARPAHVTTVNLDPSDPPERWIDHIVGDACTLRLDGYDLVFSNSLLEHVGGHLQRRQLAQRIQAAAPRWWVQTPNRWFPIEPHFVVPGMQFMPTPVRATVAAHWHAGPRRMNKAAARKMVEGIDLIGRRELAGLFPDARIVVERFAGMPKSIIAVRA